MHTGASLAGTKDAGVAPRWDPGVEDRKLRVLALAVLCSLVLHALILLFLASLREFSQARSTPPLTARFAKPKLPPEPPIVAPLPRVPVTRSVPTAKPRAQPVPAAPVPAPPTPLLNVEPSKQAAEAALGVPAAPPPPVPKAELQAVPAATSGPDPASIARFRLELMEVAARYERYPRLARENEWEGRVELTVAFAESGAIASMTVKKSTGRTVLDEAAQAMIRSAQPHAVIPPALRGRAFALETAVIFRLKK